MESDQSGEVMNPQIERLVKLLRQKLPTHEGPEAAAKSIQEDFAALGNEFSPAMVANLEEAVAIVKSSLQSIEILRRNSIVKPRDDWYTGPRERDQHWPALHGYLENAKGWDDDSIMSIGESSGEVVSMLANPAKDQFRCRGLVVGYVQSGKTANMTAVIAKAVDAGYNLIVLFGGVTNKLRAQTQRRIESDICARHRPMWQLYTTHEDNGDFTIPANRAFTMPVAGRAQLAVMKKEVSRLDAFLRTIELTPPAVLGSLKTLIIDDECDQASVNAGEEHDPTKINERIRKVIRALPAVSYVGYTATPFANVFINPFPRNKEELDDLYPEDFITALPRPKDYFGAREVFGFEPDDANEEGGEAAGRNMIRPIEQDEVAKVRPSTTKAVASFVPTIAGELEKALFWFLISSAIRRRRGHVDAHMTMLVHTSPNVIQHTRMADAIRGWIVVNEPALRTASGDAWLRLETVWDEETKRVPLSGAAEQDIRPADLAIELNAVLDAVTVAVENGESVERLNYHTEGPMTYIVVGGSVLARGLTLEGLSVSYFLRTSQQYDTLLQMGRWFGFRHGYDDLPRLWTTKDLISNFRSLAKVEDEIREEISVYRERRATPIEFAVKVRQIPGLAITSAGKMRHAYRTSISFEGKHVQTIRFDHLSTTVISNNWSAASRLVNESLSDGRTLENGSLIRSVPIAIIRKFLRDYDLCEEHLDLKKEMLLEYIDKAAVGLKEWNVAVVMPEKGPLSAEPLGALGSIPMSRRSRLPDSDAYADIKALMSKGDILVDAPPGTKAGAKKWDALKAERPAVPLLLLYPIDRQSEPRPPRLGDEGRPSRVALNAAGDLVGIGIVFPGSLDHSGSYFSVELDVPTPEQLSAEDNGEFT
jgi:hypothetical protein